jgi:hypothetical protein
MSDTFFVPVNYDSTIDVLLDGTVVFYINCEHLKKISEKTEYIEEMKRDIMKLLSFPDGGDLFIAVHGYNTSIHCLPNKKRVFLVACGSTPLGKATAHVEKIQEHLNATRAQLFKNQLVVPV